MKTLTRSILAALPLWMCVVVIPETWAQPGGAGRDRPNASSAGNASAGNASGGGRVADTSGAGGRGDANAGDTSRPPGGRELRTESGSIPDIFSRRANANNGANSPNNQQGRPASGRSGQNGLLRDFVDNALKFDSNDDRQLAAHELRNLFLVLTAGMQQQNSVQTGTGNSVPTNPSTVSVGNSAASSSTPQITPAQQPLIQQQSVRQAVLLFLQLALQFDLNGDGQLNALELQALALSLLQTDMNLVAAASTNASGRSGIQQTSMPRVASQPTTNLRPSVPQPFVGLRLRNRDKESRNGRDWREGADRHRHEWQPPGLQNDWNGGGNRNFEERSRSGSRSGTTPSVNQPPSSQPLSDQAGGQGSRSFGNQPAAQEIE
ncbi:MAG: hypothetical protein R3C59_10120 [Planctomycetaceae bacterium]